MAKNKKKKEPSTGLGFVIAGGLAALAAIELKAHLENKRLPKVCTGCGHLENEKLPEGKVCCPDNNHIPMKEYIANSKYTPPNDKTP